MKYIKISRSSLSPEHLKTNTQGDHLRGCFSLAFFHWSSSTLEPNPRETNAGFQRKDGGHGLSEISAPRDQILSSVKSAVAARDHAKG